MPQDRYFEANGPLRKIGSGEIGGQAAGRVFFQDMLAAEYDPTEFPDVEVRVPAFVVVATGVFDAFMEQGDLGAFAASAPSDNEIAERFQEAELPVGVVAELRSLLDEADFPLAVRSSSLLEDAIFRPFAGVYETKMIPNNQASAGDRLDKLLSAVELVYASTFFRAARSYLQASGKQLHDEKMAVVVQEVVGTPRGDDRFYPCLSGVGRSYDFYSGQGAKPEDGVVNLALGLGKTIVDGGVCWSYSPGRPQAPPPYGSVGELMKGSQLKFWCLNLGPLSAARPTEESEHLIQADLGLAESDGALSQVASTYDAARDRLVPGVGVQGPRVLNFAPLLVSRTVALNDVVRRLLSICEAAAGAEVEIEFAVSLAQERNAPARLGFLQLRPMVVCHQTVEVTADEFTSHDVVVASERVMGNGTVDGICDIVFVKPDTFESRHTRAIAQELDQLNRKLASNRRPYLLVGFGRWGSSDPWLGIPVDWGQISAAKVIVEATRPDMNVEPSQGSHFFHNISSFQVSYLCVHHNHRPGIDWDWLTEREPASETTFLRHVELSRPLVVKVDGRSGRAVVRR